MDQLILVATYGWRKERLTELESRIDNPQYDQFTIKRGINLINALDQVNKYTFTSYEAYHIMSTDMAIDQDIFATRSISIAILCFFNFLASIDILNKIIKLSRNSKTYSKIILPAFCTLYTLQIVYLPMYRRIKWNRVYRKRLPLKAFHIWAIKKAIPKVDLADNRKLTHNIGVFIDGL